MRSAQVFVRWRRLLAGLAGLMVAVTSLPANEIGAELAAIDGPLAGWRLHEAGFVCVDTQTGVERVRSLAAPFGWTTRNGDSQVFESSLWNRTEPGSGEPVAWMDRLLSWQAEEDRIVARWTTAEDAAAQVESVFSLVDDQQLQLELRLVGAAAVAGGNRTAVRWFTPPDERFMGFGMRQESVAFRGQRLHTWNSEGRMGEQPQPEPERYGNAQVPTFLSTRGYGCLVDGFRETVFDCASPTAGPVMTITRWHRSLSCRFFVGADPLAILRATTAVSGRIARRPPPWAFGVWATSVPRGSQTGSERSRQVAATIRAAGIPCSAIWHHYWSHQMSNLLGTKGWQLNEERYPDYQALVDAHHADGFKILQYFWPYIATGDQLYNDAAAAGRFMTNDAGAPFTFPFAFFLFYVAEPDFTDPAVVDWFHDTIFRAGARYGVDGWMADFGEYHRVGMRSAAGESGWSLHNRYAALWAEVNASFWEKERPDGDYAFFMRTGTTGSQRHAPIMWTADQEVSWDEEDGIGAVVPAVLSAGLSGFPILSTDIAGYHYDQAPDDLRQLWLRWCELGALLPVMRLHEGDELHLGRRWRFDSDATTLAGFGTMARLHVALAPWFMTLAETARQEGLPVVRPLYLHHPDEAATPTIKDQFIVGDRLLVAPVLTEDAVERSCYLPAGRWWHWWSGEAYEGPATVTVSAPIGEIPLFVKDGTLLPLYDGQIDSLAPVDDPELRGWPEVDQTMVLRYYGNGSDTLTLWDGPRLAYRRDYGAAGELTVADGPERSYRVIDPRSGYQRQVRFRLSGAHDARTVGIDAEPGSQRAMEAGAIRFVGLQRSRTHRFIFSEAPLTDQ